MAAALAGLRRRAMRLRRRRSTLSYEVPQPTAPLLVMADALARMQGRRSTAEWRRACEASLRASRRRRGLPVGSEDVVVRLLLDDRATARFREVDRQLRQAGRVGITTEEAVDRMRLLAGKRPPR